MTERNPGFAGAALLAVAALFTGAAASTPAFPQEAGPTYLYVAIQGEATVTIIDTETLEIVDVVDLQSLGFSPNAKPHHIVVEPDGAHWYLSMIGENRVLKFDRDNRLVGQADF